MDFRKTRKNAYILAGRAVLMGIPVLLLMTPLMINVRSGVFSDLERGFTLC